MKHKNPSVGLGCFDMIQKAKNASRIEHTMNFLQTLIDIIDGAKDKGLKDNVKGMIWKLTKIFCHTLE